MLKSAFSRSILMPIINRISVIVKRIKMINKTKIKEEVERFFQLREEIDELEEMLEALRKESSQVESSLFKDRPKEYVKEVLAFLKDRQAKYESYNRFHVLIFEVEEWFKTYDDYFEERLKYSTPKEKAMLLGEDL